MKEQYPVAIFNGPIVTTNGTYRVSDISVQEAKRLIKNNDFISAVGHSATSEILSDIFDENITLNRIQFHQKPGQKAIVFKLNLRPREGDILDRKQIEEIGFSLKLLERLD
jgi:hypothetical protein